MSDDENLDERSREEKLKSLIQRDIDPEITRLAKRALQHTQTGSFGDVQEESSRADE